MGWDRWRRNISLSFRSSAVRFLSFGVAFARQTPRSLRMRRKSNPRRGAVAATTAPSSLREKRQASGGVRYSSGPDFHNCCSTALLNERLPLLADSLKKSKILPRQNSRKSLSVADSFWGCVLHVAERICSSRRGPPCLTALNASAALKNLVPTAARTSIEPAPLGPFAMSASLIGRLRSNTFRLSATVSMSPHGLVLLFGIGTRALVWGFFCQEVR